MWLWFKLSGTFNRVFCRYSVYKSTWLILIEKHCAKLWTLTCEIKKYILERGKELLTIVSLEKSYFVKCKYTQDSCSEKKVKSTNVKSERLKRINEESFMKCYSNKMVMVNNFNKKMVLLLKPCRIRPWIVLILIFW